MIKTVREFLNELQKLPEEQLDLPVYMWDYADNIVSIDSIGLVQADKNDAEYWDIKEGDEYIVISD